MLSLESTGPLARVQPGEELGQPGDPNMRTVGAELSHYPTPVVVIFSDACLQSIGAFRPSSTA